MPVKEPILFVIDQFVNPYAGTEGQLLKLLQMMPAAGFEPRLLVLKNSSFIHDQPMPCRVDVLSHHRLSSPGTWLSLWRYAKRSKANGISLAHVFFNDASLICPPVFRLAGIQTLISRRDMGYWYTPLLVRLLRFTRRWVTGVVVNSEAVRKVTEDVEGYKHDQVHVIYNGYSVVDITTLKPVPELNTLRTLGPVALLVANIRPIKRISDAVAALALLKGRGHNMTLAVIGGGDITPLKRQAEALGVSDRILFLGKRSDVASCLAYGAVGLSCSESEGYSNSVVEYMQAGLPVVASDVGGNREAVVDGVTGCRYLAGNIEALADRLQSLLVDHEKRKAMGREGKKLAIQRHELEGMIQAHAQLYSELSGFEIQASVK